MTEADYEPLTARLCELWYRKFPDAELADWCHRMTPYSLRDVLAALDAHKAGSKFHPRVSEILARLKGREEGRPGEGENPAKPLADVVRDVWRDKGHAVDGMHAWEVIVRFYRAQWRAYRARAAARRKGIPDHRQDFIDAHDLRVEAFRGRCRLGCAGALVDAGLDAGTAARAADMIEWDGSTLAAGLDDLLASPPAPVDDPGAGVSAPAGPGRLTAAAFLGGYA